MEPGRCVLWILVAFLWKSSGSEALQNVTAKAGRSCVLWSRGPSYTTVLVLRCWRQERYSPFVFFYRDDRVESAGQDPSFSERVELVNSDFSTGGLSVVIRNVMIEDRGTYECLVLTSDESKQVSRISVMVMVIPDGEEMAGHKEEVPPTNPAETVRGRHALIVCKVGMLAVAVAVTVLLFF